MIIAIEEAGVPLPAPGDLVIAFYGFRVRDDPIEIAKVILVCAAASTTGTLMPYAAARRWGMTAASWLSRSLDISPEHMNTWADRIAGNGFRAVLIGRLIPGLRVAMSVIAGTAGVPAPTYAAAVFVAATVYWTGWVLLGAILGPAVEDLIAPSYLGYIALAFPVALVGLFVLRRVWTRRYQR